MDPEPAFWDCPASAVGAKPQIAQKAAVPFGHLAPLPSGRLLTETSPTEGESSGGISKVPPAAAVREDRFLANGVRQLHASRGYAHKQQMVYINGNRNRYGHLKP